MIHVELEPATGRLSATAAVTFTALEDLDVAVFGLNNALQVESVSDGAHGEFDLRARSGGLDCQRDACGPDPQRQQRDMDLYLRWRAYAGDESGARD